MSITSSVLAFALFSAAGKAFPPMRPLSMLENNTSQTAASAAAYMSSAGLVSSIPALTVLRAEGVITIPELTGLKLTLWLLAISVLGVVVAIPLKRNLINAEQLKFPSGVQCAETIKAMHSSGKEGMEKARAPLGTGAFAAAVKFLFECKLGFLKVLPEAIALPGRIRGYPLASWSFAMNTSLMLYAAGAIMGLKVTVSLAVGPLVNYGYIGPWLLDHGVLRVATEEVARDPARWAAFEHATELAHAIPLKSHEALHAMVRSKWSVWPGTALMVSASIMAFAFRWRMIVRALSGLTSIFSRGKARDAVVDPLAEVQVPTRWFVSGSRRALAGAALAVAEEYAPRHWRKYLPSATGPGIAMAIDANDSLAMLLGALIAYAVERRNKDLADRYIVSVSSGVVAGESLMGIVVIVLRDVLHLLPSG